MPNIFDLLLVGLAAVAAGAINALAGGGTLVTFPTLLAIGIPAVSANVTNTVALCPGYLGGILAQLKDLQDQKGRLWIFIPAGAVGGLIGGFLLLISGEKVFQTLVPILILLASGLLAVQDVLKAWLLRRSKQERSIEPSVNLASVPVGLAAVYGGYFGAGLSVIVLAVIGLVLDDSLTRLNALKQAIAFSTNVAAAVLFAFSGKVVWSMAFIMAIGALLGGVLGGRLAGRVKPSILRAIVVVIGVTVGIIYLVR
jgi:uncharacterized membrane protein YfcA